jgi:hypothetical protein
MEELKNRGVAYYTNARTNQQMPMYYQLYQDFINNAGRLNIKAAIERLEIPVLICHGTQDTSVAVEKASIFINFGGYPYYYNDGFFFNYYGGYYQPVYAPRGIRVGILPYGYISFNFGPKRYYYYNGIYYLPFNNDKEYEVIDAPVGAQISDLPKGAKSVVVNGEKFYEFNGTYYKKDVDSKGKEVYTVTGKDGEVNNTEEAPAPVAGQPLKIGDILPQLPDGTRSVMENGQQVFVAPDGTYFKLHSDGKTTGYLVTALPVENKLPVSEQEL